MRFQLFVYKHATESWCLEKESPYLNELVKDAQWLFDCGIKIRIESK